MRLGTEDGWKEREKEGMNGNVRGLDHAVLARGTEHGQLSELLEEVPILHPKLDAQLVPRRHSKSKSVSHRSGIERPSAYSC